MSGAPPVDRVEWKLYSPFQGVRVYAEFTLAERVSGRRRDGVRRAAFSSKRYDQPELVSSLDVETGDYFVMAHQARGQTRDRAGRASASYPQLPRLADGLAAAEASLSARCFERVDETGFRVTEAGLLEVHLIDDLCSGCCIGLQAAIWPRDSDDTDVGDPGVRMFINSRDHYGDATLENFRAWVRFVERFDLFQTSLAAVQLAASGRVEAPEVRSAPQPVRRRV
jgi:hypothetical protein